MLQPHEFKVHLEFFGDQHWDGGVGALAHFDIGHDQDDLAIGCDADEGVGREAVNAGRCRIAAGRGQSQTEHQAAARGCCGQ